MSAKTVLVLIAVRFTRFTKEFAYRMFSKAFKLELGMAPIRNLIDQLAGFICFIGSVKGVTSFLLLY